VVVPVAVGKTRLNEDERERVEAAVHAAEQSTGLQFLVYLGASARDTKRHAQKVLVHHGYHEKPGILLFVVPKRRKVEVVTSESARSRISDDQANRSVEIMVPALSRGDWVAGIELGISALAEDAGPLPPGQTPGEDLPDLM
jgi:uncharacterized membrane protein YgcG